MACDEFFRLNEHAARAAARIEDTPLMGLKHIHQQFNNAARGIELSALLAFGQGKFPEEILNT